MRQLDELIWGKWEAGDSAALTSSIRYKFYFTFSLNGNADPNKAAGRG